MAVTKTKLKRDDCKGEDGDVCKIEKDFELDDFVFDKCSTCLGVFNHRKVGGQVTEIIKKERTTKKSKVKPKYKQEKLF
jgi:hypothetical protein